MNSIKKNNETETIDDTMVPEEVWDKKKNDTYESSSIEEGEDECEIDDSGMLPNRSSDYGEGRIISSVGCGDDVIMTAASEMMKVGVGALVRWLKEERRGHVYLDDEEEEGEEGEERTVSVMHGMMGGWRTEKFENGSGAIGGLVNKGQTCFVNSTLQALAALCPMIQFLSDTVENRLYEAYTKGLTEREKDSAVLAEKLLTLLRGVGGTSKPLDTQDDVEVSSCRALDASPILLDVGKRHAQFSNQPGKAALFEQQDAHEFLQALMATVLSHQPPPPPFPPRSLNPYSDSGEDEEPPILSLAALLRTLHRQQHLPLPSPAPPPHHTNSTSASKEEKKQNDYDEDDTEPYPPKKFHPILSHPHPPPSSSMQITTPSPLSGWIGSLLRCRTCHHLRPIQNAPFIDISLSPSPEASSLHRCLVDYTSLEIVSNVQCLNCALMEKIEALEDDLFLLEDAIRTLSEPNEALKEERDEISSQLEYFYTIDPDSDLSTENQSESSLRPVRRDADKRLLFTRFPSVLCLHIQRRHYNPNTNRMIKLQQYIDFPQILDLGPFSAYSGSIDLDNTPRKNPIWYRLMSVIEHRGDAYSGHYQTFRRLGERWVLVSDENVQFVSWERVHQSQAYMLFYEAV